MLAVDPEGDRELAECIDLWSSLPARAHNVIRLVCLPMADPVANALVNAIQRHASVVVRKSLQEGFGLTLTEAVRKSRPVVTSAVGGIVGQLPRGQASSFRTPATSTRSVRRWSPCWLIRRGWHPWDDGHGATSASTT